MGGRHAAGRAWRGRRAASLGPGFRRRLDSVAREIDRGVFADAERKRLALVEHQWSTVVDAGLEAWSVLAAARERDSPVARPAVKHADRPRRPHDDAVHAARRLVCDDDVVVARPPHEEQPTKRRREVARVACNRRRRLLALAGEPRGAVVDDVDAVGEDGVRQRVAQRVLELAQEGPSPLLPALLLRVGDGEDFGLVPSPQLIHAPGVHRHIVLAVPRVRGRAFAVRAAVHRGRNREGDRLELLRQAVEPNVRIMPRGRDDVEPQHHPSGGQWAQFPGGGTQRGSHGPRTGAPLCPEGGRILKHDGRFEGSKIRLSFRTDDDVHRPRPLPGFGRASAAASRRRGGPRGAAGSPQNVFHLLQLCQGNIVLGCGAFTRVYGGPRGAAADAAR
mmetsp:Transcript_20150/g.69426  ORF Transcript_20150/g.69426 Transcript_20150/m.69426 type:complete len:391 (-) Transcript_20150:230-1402(-)